jgi:uncharacterized protein (TIRG00374 family)
MEKPKKSGNPLKKPSFWIRIIFSVGLLAFLISQVDLSEIWQRLITSNGWYILLAFLLGMVDRVLMAFKWNVLLKAKGMNIPLAQVTFVYWKTTFLGLFLPATVGGDALRAYALSRKNYPMSDVVSSIIVERALGFLALFVMVIISVLASIFLLGETFFDGMTSLLLVFGALSIVAIVGMYFTMRQDILKRIGRFVDQRGGKLVQNKIAQKLREIVRSYASFGGNMRVMAWFFVLSLIENLFPLMWAYLLSLAFGIEVPVLYFFILIPIVLVLIRLPISLDGFGINEGAFVFFLGLIGVSSEEGFLLGLSFGFLARLIVLPGGIFYMLQGMDMPENAEALQQATAQATPPQPATDPAG